MNHAPKGHIILYLDFIFPAKLDELYSKVFTGLFTAYF